MAKLTRRAVLAALVRQRGGGYRVCASRNPKFTHAAHSFDRWRHDGCQSGGYEPLHGRVQPT